MNKKNLRIKRKQNRELENETFILNAAEKIFSLKGYGLTSVDDIAREAQFSKATLYRYFKSKRDIFVTVVFNSFEEAHKKIKKIQQRKVGAEEKLKDLTSYIANYYHKKINIVRIFHVERSSMKKILTVNSKERLSPFPFHPRIPENFRAKSEEISGIIRRIIEEGIESGEFRNVNAQDASYVFGALIRGFYFRGPFYNKEYSVKEATELIHHFFLHGIK